MSTLESLYRGSGNYRIVWEVTYAYDHQHRVDDGRGDTRHSHFTRERNIVHFIAPTYALVKALFDHKYPKHVNYQFVEAVPLCTINDEMDLTRGWRA